MASIDGEGATDLTESPQAHTEAPTSTTAPLSKKAQKKAVKAAHRADQKLERRHKEKEAKKAKKRIRAEKRAAGELEEDEVREEEEKRRTMKRAKTGAGQKPFAGRVCIDLGFDDMMTDKASGMRNNDVDGTTYTYQSCLGNYIFVLTTWIRI